MVFEVLNRLKWKGGLEDCEIVIRHRGAPGDVLTLSGSSLTELKRDHFMYINEMGEETFIPLHRILEVRSGSKVLWKKKVAGQ